MNGISVVTLVGGRELHLRNMVAALSRSALPPQELVVGALDFGAYEGCAAPFPIRIVRLPARQNEPRLRLAEARNLAARAARGKILMFLDVDCMVAAGTLHAVADILEDDHAIVCPEVYYLRHPIGADWAEADILANGIPHPARMFPRHGVRREDNAGLLWSVAFALHAATFDRIGGFDAGYVGYGAEDTDFGFSARAHGTPMLLLGGTRVFHQCHAVYYPPLQHFEDIVLNARRFMTKWGVWPMADWLTDFAARGLIAWHPKATTISMLRAPDAGEIAASRQPPGTPF